MKDNNYILIVEDSRTQARQLESILKQIGYPVSIAYNGKEALSFAKRQKPTVVISDILMPEMDGYQLCKLMKIDEKLKDIPIVLLTQLSDPKEIIRGLECGADDFIIKPYNEELLLARVQAILTLRSKRDAAAKEINILIVEDSPTQAEQLKFLLEECGYTILVAANGKEGLDVARKNKPTLVISDILMPVMDGYELAYEIKRDEELKKIPIILVTSLMDRKDVIRKASVVADGYFTKPYDDEYLLSKIESLLSISGREERTADTSGLEVFFAGERFAITSSRRQILNFLLSIYENTIRQNRDLILMQHELQSFNEQLEEKVEERTRQLQLSEEKYRTLLETNTDAIIVVSKEQAVCFANKAALLLFGLKIEELVNKPFSFSVAAGETKDAEINRTDGKKAFAEMRVVETTWGEKKAYLATFRDITERKRIEEARRESEENFRSLAENANDGIAIINLNGNIVYANRRFADMTGSSIDELLTSSIKDHTDPDKFLEIKKLYRQMLKGSPYLIQHETVILKKNGENIPVEITFSKSLWHSQNAVIIIVRDITERKKREGELIRASKFESLSTLAGGIAHDFNNLLTAILGNVSLARASINPQDEIYKVLADLEKASLRAKDLTQQLLTFAKGGNPIKKTASIGELIKDSSNFVLRGSKTRCDFSMAKDLWPLEVDEGQMNQVMHNLIINAEQAMPDGGVIKVTAENITVGTAEKKLPIKDGKYVKIRIKDTGTGIPEKHLTKIFDPYFTTKKEGSGLGLATAYAIIKNHNGYISVESKVGLGTTFTIYLPASSKGVRTVESGENNILTGKGRILVMDDEEIVRDVVGKMLTKLGYDVEFAKDGIEAIEMYIRAKEAGHPFNVIIMDLTIPGGMGGKETIKKIFEIDRNVKAIVSSGYSDDSIMSDFGKYGFSAVIAKPYLITELSKTVHQVLMGGNE